MWVQLYPNISCLIQLKHPNQGCFSSVISVNFISTMNFFDPLSWWSNFRCLKFQCPAALLPLLCGLGPLINGCNAEMDLGEKHHSKPIISSYLQFIKGQSLNTFWFQISISLTYYQVLPLSLKDCAHNGTAVCSQACPNIAICIVQITKEQTTLGWSPYNIRINCKFVNILYICRI